MEKEREYMFGKHAIFEALKEKPEIIKRLFVDSEIKLDQKRIAILERSKIDIRELDIKKMSKIIGRDAVHQGLVAEINSEKLLIPYKKFIENLEIDNNSALLVLGEVQDPHNVGAVIRSAAAFGLKGVLIPPHRQSPVTGTVIKVSAGMAFRIPLVLITNVNSAVRDLKKKGFWVYGLDGDGETSTVSEIYSKPSVFILGNEGRGLRKKTRELCDNLLSIPIHPRTESLNASVATAVALSSWSRQHSEAIQNNFSEK